MIIENNELKKVTDTDIENGTFIIPDYINTIGFKAFEECYSLKNIIIPKNITKIDSWEFTKCHSLENVIINAELSEIDDGVFAGCHSLKNITLPKTVERIKDFAFANCESLENLVMSNNVKIIKDASFVGCIELKNIVMSNELIEIGSIAFGECFELKSIVLPKTLEYIRKDAFRNCFSLENIDLFSYKTFELLSDDIKITALKSVIKKYYEKRIEYTLEDINKFSEYLKQNKKQIIKYLFEESIDKETIYIILFKMNFIKYEDIDDILTKIKDNEIKAMLLEYSKRFKVDPFEKFNLDDDFDGPKKILKI